MGNLSIRCGMRNTGSRSCACPQRSSASMSFSWLFLGGLVSTRARFRFTNRGQACSKLTLPVEHFSANGKLSLNCLSHPRGQAQSHPRVVILGLWAVLFALVSKHWLSLTIISATRNITVSVTLPLAERPPKIRSDVWERNQGIRCSLRARGSSTAGRVGAKVWITTSTVHDLCQAITPSFSFSTLGSAIFGLIDRVILRRA